MQRALPLLVASFLAAPAIAQAQTEISLEEVPPAIIDAAETTAPGVQFHRVSTEVENGRVVYEFEAYNSAGKHVEVDIREDGSIQEIEMEIAISQTPAHVRDALEETAPGFEAGYVEYSVRDGGAEFVYEFKGDQNGRTLEIEIAENGSVLFVSDGSVG